jgi:hypothetical protein
VRTHDHRPDSTSEYTYRLGADQGTQLPVFLYEAELLVTGVKSVFRNSDDFATAARLKNIQARLADEIRAVERLIATSKSVFRH